MSTTKRCQREMEKAPDDVVVTKRYIRSPRTTLKVAKVLELPIKPTKPCR